MLDLPSQSRSAALSACHKSVLMGGLNCFGCRWLAHRVYPPIGGSPARGTRPSAHVRSGAKRPIKASLFDHLVGAGEQRGRHFEAERPRRDQVHNEIEFSRLLNREIARLRPAQDLVDIVGGAPK